MTAFPGSAFLRFFLMPSLNTDVIPKCLNLERAGVKSFIFTIHNVFLRKGFLCGARANQKSRIKI
jgi:hypothetical protein